MNQKNKALILQKIREYPCIFLFRHIRADGDCTGAAKGLQQILKCTFPEKEVYIIDNEQPQRLAFLGSPDPEVPDEMYRQSLGIVLDSGDARRISNPKYALCKEIIKIDHHIPTESYADYEWVEPERSSACEMIADFYCTFRDQLKIDANAALYLYTGMVSDTGHFRYRNVNGETLRLAGFLLDQGIDTEKLNAHLYLEDLSYLHFKAQVCSSIQVTPNGVAYLVIDKAMMELFSLSQETAGACVDFMESIKGCLCWIAFIENEEERSIRVRLRSRFVHINEVAQKYRGGGHACACGATLYSEKEIHDLLQDMDALVKNYKETCEDWL